MKISKSTRATATLMLVGMCCWAQAQAPSEFVIAQGETVYRQHCAVCHGQGGRPNTPAGQLLSPKPRDFSDPVDMARVSFDQMYSAIKDGRPGTAMAPWRGILNEEDVRRVIVYIHRTFQGSS